MSELPCDHMGEQTSCLDERLLFLIDERRAEEAQRGIRALELAPTLELYQALMRGERVPLELLNRDAVVRYGLRS